MVELFFKKRTAFLVYKELQIERSALTTSRCHLPAKHECCVPQSSAAAETLFTVFR